MTDTKHTDSVESLAKELRMVANMINMGEKIQWGHETTLMDKAADMLTTLHTPKDTNSPDSISTEKDRYQHTDSVEVSYLTDIAIEVWNQNCDKSAPEAMRAVVTALQAHTSQQVENWHKESFDRGLELGQQQVEEAVLQADATGAYHSGYLAGKAEVEEAVRKERERIEEQVLTPLYEKIDKWFQEKHDIIGQGALAAVFEEALQAITPNHQD